MAANLPRPIQSASSELPETPDANAIPLSVVLATNHPSKETNRVLRELAGQLERVGGELLVATGGEQAIPDDLRSLDAVRVLPSSEESVFSLRAAAVAAAQGEVVAVTEDHCLPATGWASWVIAVHRANPGLPMIAGPVVNGSLDRATDRANFLATFAEFMPPLAAAGFRRIPPIVNVSYKRAALPRRRPRPGWLEFELNRRLVRDGNVALANGPPVAHLQSRPVAETLAMHFHNGRSTGGMRDHVPSRQLPRELLRRALLPLRLTRQAVRAVSEKRISRRQLPGDLALVFVLACCHAAGEVTGIVRGAGRSPELLE